jgi:hypothetical protein
MIRKTDRAVPPKRPYRTPSLKIHGDFRKLTSAKGGTNNDGSGKPRTKSSNPNQ